METRALDIAEQPLQAVLAEVARAASHLERQLDSPERAAGDQAAMGEDLAGRRLARLRLSAKATMLSWAMRVAVHSVCSSPTSSTEAAPLRLAAAIATSRAASATPVYTA